MQINTSKVINSVVTNQPPFSKLIGGKVITANQSLVEAELLVSKKLTNRNGVLHGGAIMAFADNIGGTLTFLNLDEGWSTTTIESKTNFLRPAYLGQKITGKCVLLHAGSKTFVLQTKIHREDKKLAAVVTQTQMILQFFKAGKPT